MAKSQLQSNPNMMVFSGDNINIPTSIPNPVLNPATNSISSPLPNNMELNVSIPNSEKNIFNLNNISNNNLPGGAFLNNLNPGSMPAVALGTQSLNRIPSQASVLNNSLANNQILGGNNLNGIGLGAGANAQLNLNNLNTNNNNGLNLGLLGNGGLSAIPQGLNASLLPQPIPIQVDKNANLGIAALPVQTGGVAVIGNSFFN